LRFEGLNPVGQLPHAPLDGARFARCRGPCGREAPEMLLQIVEVALDGLEQLPLLLRDAPGPPLDVLLDRLGPLPYAVGLLPDLQHELVHVASLQGLEGAPARPVLLFERALVVPALRRPARAL